MNEMGRRARLRYFHGQFEVRQQGDHVVCAVTGQRIHLSQLRYWSVTRQEAYISPEAALERQEQDT